MLMTREPDSAPLTLPEWAVRYLFQVIPNAAFPWWVISAFGSLGWTVERWHSPLVNRVIQSGEALSIALGGALLGVVVFAIAPRYRKLGPWVWVLPVALAVLAMSRDLSLSSIDRVMNTYLFSREGMGPTLMKAVITYPAWSSIWYSVSCSVLRRRSKAPSESARSASHN